MSVNSYFVFKKLFGEEILALLVVEPKIFCVGGRVCLCVCD